MARSTYLSRLGLFLFLSCSAWGGTLDTASVLDLAVQVEQPEAWRGLFASVGIEPTTEPARFRVLVGDDPAAIQLGFRPTDRTVQVASVVDKRSPNLKIVWQNRVELTVYEMPEAATVFVREKRTGAPLLAGLRQAAGGVLWTAVGPGDEGFERFPYLMHALVDLGLRLPFRDDRRHVFFDSSYRARVDLDYMARRWRRGGVHALHIAAWHFTDAGPDAYLEELITACHRQGILAYAWLELPHVSEAFWEQNPNCREQTAALQDARLDWRKLINLADPDCFSRAAAGVQDLLSGYDWDGVNLAELYFESLHGPSNPARFTPMNQWVRDDYQRRNGIDPLEIFNPESPHLWSRNDNAWQRFAAYRSELTLRLQRQWLEKLRSNHPQLDLMVTQIDDRLDPQMKEYLGADAASLLPLASKYDFRLVIEDPATLWDRGPSRYTEIAKRYEPLADDPERLAIDINIVERYQQTYPTKKQVGGELLQLLHAAGSVFPSVLLYFEHSISRPDWDLLPHAVSGVDATTTGAGLTVHTRGPVGVSRPGPVEVNGAPWPVGDEETIWLPAGRHVMSPSATRPPMRLLRLTGDLKAASAQPSGVHFTYNSKARAIALVDREPDSVLVDGEPFTAPILRAKRHWAVMLPRGHRTVLITAGGLLR
jgi:hypothetical protein